MAITVGGRTYRTLDDDIYVNGSKVKKVHANGVLVYPDKKSERHRITVSGSRSLVLTGDYKTFGADRIAIDASYTMVFSYDEEYEPIAAPWGETPAQDQVDVGIVDPDIAVSGGLDQTIPNVGTYQICISEDAGGSVSTERYPVKRCDTVDVCTGFASRPSCWAVTSDSNKYTLDDAILVRDVGSLELVDFELNFSCFASLCDNITIGPEFGDMTTSHGFACRFPKDTGYVGYPVVDCSIAKLSTILSGAANNSYTPANIHQWLTPAGVPRKDFYLLRELRPGRDPVSYYGTTSDYLDVLRFECGVTQRTPVKLFVPILYIGSVSTTANRVVYGSRNTGYGRRLVDADTQDDIMEEYEFDMVLPIPIDSVDIKF